MRRTLLVALLTLAACSPSRADDPAGTDGGTGDGSRSPIADIHGVPDGGTAVPIRSCQSHVVGDISGFRRYSTTIGAVSFVGLEGYAEAPDRVFRPRGERYPALKALLVVERGRAVTIELLEPNRARLVYDPARWGSRNRYRMDDLPSQMVFEPCDFLPRTQFNGVLLVTGRTCITIEVTLDERKPDRATVPIGVKTCGPEGAKT